MKILVADKCLVPIYLLTSEGVIRNVIYLLKWLNGIFPFNSLVRENI